MSVQSVKGLFAVFANGKRMIETNEYDLLKGTVAILCHHDMPALPVQRLEVKKKDLVIDSFPIQSSGALSSNWQIQEGTWKVMPVLEGASADEDGQLVALGKGSVLIGEESWRNYLIQISASFDESEEFALLGRVDRDSALELYCRGREIEIRKVVSNSPITLVRANLPELSSGWHKIGFALGDAGATVEVDGVERLRWKLYASKGKAGIRNYGEFAAFDNLTIHIISKEKKQIDKIKNVDPLLLDIENAIMN